VNGCLRDRSWRIQVPSSELFIWHLCAMCWSLLQWPSLLQSSFRSPPLFKYKHLQERCWSYLENENCQFMCWSCANSQGGGMMEGRASLKRCSQSGARHKPLQRVSVVHRQGPDADFSVWWSQNKNFKLIFHSPVMQQTPYTHKNKTS
jgi:hypothetical protein